MTSPNVFHANDTPFYKKTIAQVSFDSILKASGIVLVRGNKVSERELVEICRRYGQVEQCRKPFFLDYPEIFPVAHSNAYGHTEIGRYWHADGAWHPRPVQFSFLYAAHGNFINNYTWFVRTDHVLAQMDDELKEIGRAIILRHPNGVQRPIIRLDPNTCIEYLHFNQGLLDRFLRNRSLHLQQGYCSGLDVEVTGIEPPKLEVFLKKVVELLNETPELYSHKWERGDILIVDNLRFLHKAIAFGTETTRVLYRVCVFA